MLTSFRKSALTSSTGFAIVVMMAAPALGQTIAPAGAASNPPRPAAATTQPATPAPVVNPGEVAPEVIVVTGVRAALENALQIRRLSDVIMDGISADDIGSTPDLNLGEALQRIPGVQINRESPRRDATISVRGLPGRFTKTTVMGQSVASTTRGQNTGNPFGIFDSSIFNGADVIKSFTADIPAGGMAANVDLRLRGALSRKNSLVFRSELGYEETTEDVNPAYYLGASRKFLGDKLGVYFNLAYSDQSFRRDTVRINGYSAFSTTPATVGTGVNAVTTEARHQQLFPTIALVGDNGLNNRIIHPNEVRQFAVSNRGTRLSGSSGLEWAPSQELRLRLDGIFTRRVLDNANNDIFSISPGDGAGIVTPLSAPRLVGVTDYNSDGVSENVYMVDQIRASDFQTIPGNRISTALDQAFAVYPQLSWQNDKWKINITGTYSEAIGENRDIQLDVALRQRASTTIGADNRIDTNGDGLDDRGNGSIAVINTGAGDWSRYVLDLTLPTSLVRGIFAPGSIYTIANDTIGAAFNIPQARTIDGVLFNSSASLRLASISQRVDRDLQAIDFQIDRDLDLGPFTTFQVGGFYSKENAQAVGRENGVLGTNLTALNPDLVKFNDAVTSGSVFGGGGLPGADLKNFLSLNLVGLQGTLLPLNRTTTNPQILFNPTAAQRANLFPELTAASAATLTNTEILNFIPLNPLSPGFTQRLPLRRVGANNYTSARETLELFAQTKFRSDNFFGMSVRGNIGVRYTKTDLSGVVADPSADFYDAVNAARAQSGTAALVFRNGGLAKPIPASSQFERILPSANVILDITDKIQVRAAYYETFEALDLAEFSPSPTRVETQETDLDDLAAPVGPFTLVNFATLDINPRRSQAFDAGISWYNRPGGVVALGLFRKSLIDDISRSGNFCPIGETISAGDQDFGPLRLVDGRCFFTNAAGINERVRINISRNNPVEIIVTGLEAQIQQRFDFLPGVLKHTGGVVNYTSVSSDSDSGAKLFNVAEQTFNVIVYYEHQWLQMRLAWNQQSEIQLQGAGSFFGGSSLVAPRGQLDFSMGIRPNERLEVRFEAFNLNNATRQEYIGFESIPRVYEFDGRTFSVSATYKF